MSEFRRARIFNRLYDENLNMITELIFNKINDFKQFTLVNIYTVVIMFYIQNINLHF